MSLIFNIEKRVVEFNGNSFPMSEKTISEFRKEFGNNRKSVELSLDTSKEDEDTLRGIFYLGYDFGGINLDPPKEEYDSSHGEGDWEFYYWNVEVCVGGTYTDFYFQRAGDGKPALNWIQDPPQEDLREEYVIFDEIDWDI